MTVAFQPPWSGQNTINIVMDRQGLLAKRGIEAKWQGFPSGPAINEVMVSARAQVGNGGNFPFTSLLDKKVPVKAIAILSPNLLHATVVPLDSPIKSLKDFKGGDRAGHHRHRHRLVRRVLFPDGGAGERPADRQGRDPQEHAARRADGAAQGHRRRRALGSRRRP